MNTKDLDQNKKNNKKDKTIHQVTSIIIHQG